MKTIFYQLSVYLFVILFIFGCTSFAPIKVTSIKEKTIPSTIVFHPLLSTEMNWIRHKAPQYPYPPRKYFSKEESQLGISEKDKSILISPPTKSTLEITEESQLLTGMLTSSLAWHGFKLKELPVDVITTNNNSDSNPETTNGFGISIHLLNRLRVNYGVEALIVGNAFFVGHRYEESSLEKKVTFVHLKVIDINTLDIIGQVTFPYNHKGANISLVSQKLSSALADMAGIKIQEGANLRCGLDGQGFWCASYAGR